MVSYGSSRPDNARSIVVVGIKSAHGPPSEYEGGSFDPLVSCLFVTPMSFGSCCDSASLQVLWKSLGFGLCLVLGGVDRSIDRLRWVLQSV